MLTLLRTAFWSASIFAFVIAAVFAFACARAFDAIRGARAD
jgi:hypothetical protein